MRHLDVIGVLGEIAFAARRLRRTPGFTLAAVLLLGVGMAIWAAAASVLNVRLFTDPVRDKGLVHIGIHSYVTYLPQDVLARVMADPPSSVEALAGFGVTRSTAVADGQSRRVAVEAVSGTYFSLFDAVPLTGRLIHEVDAQDEAMVAVISKRFQDSAFGAGADAVGSTIAVGGQRLTIIGVIEGPVRGESRGSDVWVPSHVLPVNTLLGRLRAETTIEQATSEVAARYGRFDIGGGRIRTLVVREGLSTPLSHNDYESLLTIVSLALTVSLVASASFGLLLFARMAATQSDMAVRIALGATSRDLTRLLAFEVVLLAIAATVVAVNAGSLLAHFVLTQINEGDGWHSAVDTSPDWRVFIAIGAVTLAVALAVVARLGWSVARVEALGSMVTTGGMGGATIRTADTSTRLVIAQSAAAAALLLFAALISRSAMPDRTFTYGLDLDGAAIAWIDQAAHVDTPEAGTRSARTVLDAALELPGIRHAALLSSLPGTEASASVGLNSSGELRQADRHYVSADAFAAFGLSTTRGRTFTAREDEDAQPLVVVSETAARRFWPDLEPIGRRLWVRRHDQDSRMATTVIGVVTDVEVRPGRSVDEPRAVYLPLAHRNRRSNVALVARSVTDAGPLADQLRTSLQHAVPDTGFLSVRTLEQEFYERTAPPPSLPRVFGVLGFIVFAVAIGGLYGLMSYLAAMRRREMGIRKALGATTLALCRMLAHESSRMLIAGVVIGIVGGLFLGSLWIRPGSTFRLLDPVAIFSVAGFLYLAGLVGAIAPFVRTMRARTVSLKD